MTVQLDDFEIGATADDDERLRRDEEARAAAREALANLQGLSVPAPEDGGEPPDVEAESVDFQPTTRQINRERDAALFNPEANQRAAQAVGDRWRAGQALSEPGGEPWPGSREPSTRNGEPSRGPFRTYPPGQMPPRTGARFPDEETGAPPANLPARASERAPQPQVPARGVTVDEIDPALIEMGPADEPMPPMAAMGGMDLGAPMPPADEFVDPSKPTEAPPDNRERMLAAIQAKRGAAMPQQRESAAGPDYTGVDTADAFRRVLHILGSAMRGFAGRDPLPFRSMGEQARARDRQSEQDRLRGKQDAREDERQTRAVDERSGLERERMEMQRGDMEQRRALEQERNAMQGERVSIEDRQANTRMAVLESQLRRSISEEERERAEGDPTSAASEEARATLRLRLRSRPPAAIERIEAQLGSIDGLSYRTIREHFGPSATRDMFGDIGRTAPRRRGSGGGQGGAETREARLARARAAGLSDQQIASYGSDSRGQTRLLAETERRERSALSAEGEEEGIEIAPGIRATMDIGTVDARDMRQGLSDARAHSGALGEIDAIAQRYGARAAIDPRIEAELVEPIQEMMSMVATLRNTGVINPQEAPTIEAAIPNPRNLRQMTLGEVQRRVQSFRSGLERRIRANLAVRGVDEAGQNAAVEFLHSGRFQGARSEAAPRPAQQQRQQGAAPVTVIINGQERQLRPDAVERARQVATERGDSFEVQ